MAGPVFHQLFLPSFNFLYGACIWAKVPVVSEVSRPLDHCRVPVPHRLSLDLQLRSSIHILSSISGYVV